MAPGATAWSDFRKKKYLITPALQGSITMSPGITSMQVTANILEHGSSWLAMPSALNLWLMPSTLLPHDPT